MAAAEFSGMDINCDEFVLGVEAGLYVHRRGAGGGGGAALLFICTSGTQHGSSVSPILLWSLNTKLGVGCFSGLVGVSSCLALLLSI